MATVQLQRIIDSVVQEIQNKDGSDRYNIERNENNLRVLLQQSIITLAQDTRQFISYVSLKLEPSLIVAFTEPTGPTWELQNGLGRYGVTIHTLPHPDNYLQLREMLIDGNQMVEAGSEDHGVSDIQGVFQTLPNGWLVSAYNPSNRVYGQLVDGARIDLSYFTYPDIMGEEAITAHPLSELALIHLMLYHLQSRDPFIEFSNQLQGGQFNNASWQYNQYEVLARRILDLTGQSTIKSITNIKPYYS
jgi:hypothetical protein